MPERVLFPKNGFTTKDLVGVYEQLAPALLPHLAHRPLTLKRFPDTVYGEAFWEKDAPDFTPDRIPRLPVPRKHGKGLIHYVSLSTVDDLRWAASLGCVEIHPFLHLYPFITSPTAAVLDLDPGPGTGVIECCEVALDVRQWFERWGMESFAKLSGSKGMQVYVPLNTPSSYAATEIAARKLAEELEQRHPQRITSRMPRSDRAGRVFIDWSQNADYKTTVGVYSVRAKSDQPFVSVPLSWLEVQNAIRKRRPEDLRFTPEQTIHRVQRVGDLFAPVLTLQQEFPKRMMVELGIPASPAPKAVHVTERADSSPTLPRSSGQGGRRLFVVHRRKPGYELGIEENDQFNLYQLRTVPAHARETARLAPAGSSPLAYLTEESSASGLVWDLGTYELVEGSLEKDHARIYMTGRRMRGLWDLLRDSRGWILANEGGRIIHPFKAHESALTSSRGAPREPLEYAS